MTDNKEFLDFFKNLKTWVAYKDSPKYTLSQSEIKELKNKLFDYNAQFSKDLKSDKKTSGSIKFDKAGRPTRTGGKTPLYKNLNDENAAIIWIDGLRKQLNLDKLDLSNPDNIKKHKALLDEAVSIVKGEEYAEQLTGEKGFYDSKLEDIFEDSTFEQNMSTQNQIWSGEVYQKMRGSKFIKYFKTASGTDFSKDNINKVLSDLNPELKKELMSTGDINLEKALDTLKEPSSNHPNAGITTQEIIDRFLAGDKTNSIDVDAVNALPSTALEQIMDAGIPLTDEARSTYLNFLKFSTEEKRNKFINHFYSKDEVKNMQTMEYNNEMDQSIPTQTFPEEDKQHSDLEVPDEIVQNQVVTEEEKIDVVEDKKPEINLEKAGQIGSNLLRGAGATLDAIGGPGAIISYIMGKKGLKEAMKEIQPQARAELSPMFMEHFRQTKELSKKGFHPSEEMKFRKELDKSYQIGLENAVRGSGGQRAKFLAQSGVLDAQRSSALLDYAVKDDEIQKKNQDKYEKIMLFKENFDIQRSEQDRLEDMQRQVATKKAAAGFTSAAFTNAMSGLNKMNVSGLVDNFFGAQNGITMTNPATPYIDQSANKTENK